MNARGRWTLWATSMLAIAGSSAVSDPAPAPSRSNDLPPTAWKRLVARRIYFGHQSVGGNIMEGVADLARDDRVPLRVRDASLTTVSDAEALVGAGVFAHGPVGRNREPRLKTDDFARRVDATPEGALDVAMHKYCYADIEHGTDVDALFRHYRDTMQRLRARHRDVVFVHVTVPLQCATPTWKGLVKQMLGRSHGRFADNLARERFNDLMRRTYLGHEPLFDLARIESTRPDGERETVDTRGRGTAALVPAYASDGSHLNVAGRRRVARELLAFLAELPVPERSTSLTSERE